MAIAQAYGGAEVGLIEAKGPPAADELTYEDSVRVHRAAGILAGVRQTARGRHRP